MAASSRGVALSGGLGRLHPESVVLFAAPSRNSGLRRGMDVLVSLLIPLSGNQPIGIRFFPRV